MLKHADHHRTDADATHAEDDDAGDPPLTREINTNMLALLGHSPQYGCAPPRDCSCFKSSVDRYHDNVYRNPDRNDTQVRSGHRSSLASRP
jgi:hypothetical protein